MFALAKKMTAFTLLFIFMAGCSPGFDISPPRETPSPLLENWDDRAIFRSGLIEAEQPLLAGLPGASIYHLDVHIADGLTSLQGIESVRYTNQETTPLDSVYFQLFPNMVGGKSAISSVSVDGQPVNPVYGAGSGSLRLPLPAPLQPGERAVIRMEFNVQVPTDAGGNYGLFGYLNHVLVLDGFYPAIPVYDEAGWHAGQLSPNSDTTFQDASFYLVRVTAPAELKLVASGMQVATAVQNGHQVVTFAAGPARDFYLAASARFEVITAMVGGTKVNSYAFKDSAAGSQLALRSALDAIESYSARLGAYPYTEFDLVSTPMQGALGIEYPGITGINLELYDLGATVNDLPASVMLESTVAHELGHQWFYNVVGNDQINAPWLDESLTQYVTGLYFLDRHGQQGWENIRNSWVVRWERVDQALIPIGLPASDYHGKEYGAIVYGRGPLFLDALEQKLGQPAFDEFLRDYYRSNRWGIGTEALFRLAAEKHCRCDLSPLFAEWVDHK
ncbi:MAG TPA: M1 family metallopeptidase [Anaerolineales bacterium]|jgi:hypothetical protein